jgi:ribosome-associated translation inhibitor RaiA
MQPNASRRSLQVDFDVHQYNLSVEERQMMLDDLDSLSLQIQFFPIADVHVLVEGNARSNDVSVKLTLILPGKTLVTNDHDAAATAAFDRCLNSMLHAIEAYKSQLDREPEHRKLADGTLHPVHPTRAVDSNLIEEAVGTGDFAAFRMATLPFEDAVQARVGRWIQRFPRFEANIGKEVTISDVTDEVFLIAFERYSTRPKDLALSDWFTSLIDPAVKSLINAKDEELENIDLVRTAMEAVQVT